MIEILSYSLPKGWIIYLKEHPKQRMVRGYNYFASRYRGYYKRIAKLKNVQLVPIETNTFELTKKSQAVATVTGTTGWEAVLRSKPVLIFGYPWYRDCPGLFRVDSPQSCKEVFNKIKNGLHANEQDVIRFLYCLDKASINASIETLSKRVHILSFEKNINNISNAIINELK